MITIDTPVGPLTMAGDGTAVTAAVFGPSLPESYAATAGDGEVPAGTVEAVRAYFAGDLAALDRVPVRHHGSAYQEHAWAVMRTLTEPVTYARFAALTGRPNAPRAAGQACARNRIALFTPCHRVLRSDGSLGGYAWGLEVKQQLLAHEAAHR